MAHAFNSSTWKADAGGFLLSSRPAWSAKQVPGQQRATQRNPISNQPTNQQTTTKKHTNTGGGGGVCLGF
jgi:hypothetical protein